MTVLGRKLVLACLLAVVSAASVAQVVRPGDEERMAVHEEFQRLFAEQRYAEALPLAQRVLQMTESVAALDAELPTAYNNLGVAQLRVGDLDGAEASFRRALELLEGRVGIVSRRLIAPLAGLGAVHTARGHSALAADALQRALAISRRASGLFNVEQLELLESLVEAYQKAGNQAGVERERRYALQVVQQEYGAEDPRTVPALVGLAESYESSRNYVAARVHWQQVVDVASRESEGRNAATILGLVGIARNHRLQFVLGPESLEEDVAALDPVTGRPNPFLMPSGHTGVVKLNREGEAAALRALAILDETPDPPKKLLVVALMEAGDWYVTVDRMSLAIPYYRRAWPLFAETLGAGEPNPLASPRPLRYRPPPAAIRSRDRTDVEVVATNFEFSMHVSASGQTSRIKSVSSGVDDYRAGQLRRSLLRAVFSPRFEDGEPVPTEDYRFTETWYDLAAPASPGTPDEPAPAGAPEPAEEPPPS